MQPQKMTVHERRRQAIKRSVMVLQDMARGKGADAKWAEKELAKVPQHLAAIDKEEKEDRAMAAKLVQEREEAAVAQEEKKAAKKVVKKAAKAAEAPAKPRDIGDAVAQFVRGLNGNAKELQRVCLAAVKKVYEGKALKVHEAQVKNAMDRPNPGLSRMALGNILRACYRKDSSVIK